MCSVLLLAFQEILHDFQLLFSVKHLLISFINFPLSLFDLGIHISVKDLIRMAHIGILFVLFSVAAPVSIRL